MKRDWGNRQQQATSVTRRLDCVFNIWPFPVMKICQKHTYCPKVSWKRCPKPKNLKFVWQRFLNIGQCGGISPNLVTLQATEVNYQREGAAESRLNFKFFQILVLLRVVHHCKAKSSSKVEWMGVLNFWSDALSGLHRAAKAAVM